MATDKDGHSQSNTIITHSQIGTHMKRAVDDHRHSTTTMNQGHGGARSQTITDKDEDTHGQRGPTTSIVREEFSQTKMAREIYTHQSTMATDKKDHG